MTESISRGSLGGQNSHRRVSGARSSRALSTLFRQLRTCDRKVAELDKRLGFVTGGHRFWNAEATAIRKRLEHWEEKRKATRLKRKGYIL